jgi:hypothetical protein
MSSADSYWGRLVHFASVTDMRHACTIVTSVASRFKCRTLLTTKSRLALEIERINAYENERKTGVKRTVSDEQYRHAVKSAWSTLASHVIINGRVLVRNSMVHPDTGKIIPAPLRFSAFVPMNMIIVLGMLTPNASVRSNLRRKLRSNVHRDSRRQLYSGNLSINLITLRSTMQIAMLAMRCRTNRLQV